MSKVGNKFYGKVDVVTRGKKQWDEQDPAKAWTDGGEIRAIVESMIPDIEKACAKNAILGASEFSSSGQAAVRADERTGEVIIGVRVSTEDADLITEVPLKQLLITALSEMKGVIGVDPGAQTTLSQLIDLGRQLSNLGLPKQQPNHSQAGVEKIARKFAPGPARAVGGRNEG